MQFLESREVEEDDALIDEFPHEFPGRRCNKEMLSNHTTCFPPPDVPANPTPWGDPRPSYPVWPMLPPWAQPVYAPRWQPPPDIWA